MHYKTIILELLKQRPEMHKQLRKQRTLLATMESYAQELKASHEAWKEQVAQARPGSEANQISSEAFEMALQELQERLPPASPAQDGDSPELDQALAFLRNPSSRD